jgi:hypothetical protein
MEVIDMFDRKQWICPSTPFPGWGRRVLKVLDVDRIRITFDVEGLDRWVLVHTQVQALAQDVFQLQVE